MTTTYSNNKLINNLPGVNNGIFAIQNSNSGLSVTSSITSEAISIRNKQGESILTFHNDGMIEAAGSKIRADEWVQITLMMKQLIMDLAQDEELSKKYPYVKDMAHGWVMKELGK